MEEEGDGLLGFSTNPTNAGQRLPSVPPFDRSINPRNTAFLQKHAHNKYVRRCTVCIQEGSRLFTFSGRRLSEVTNVVAFRDPPESHEPTCSMEMTG